MIAILFIEICCLMASLFFQRGEEKRSIGESLRLYLSIIVLTEVFGLWLPVWYGVHSNKWMYNLYMPFIALFLDCMLFHAIRQSRPLHYLWLASWWLLYIIVYACEYVWPGRDYIYLKHTRLFLDISISLACFGRDL